MKSGVSQAIRDADGAIFAVTGEPQTLADEARESWELDFPTVGDPHLEIVAECRERGWLSLFVNPDYAFLKQHAAWAAHPNGYLQPGVLAVSNERRVLYRWRSRPLRSNISGALSRPMADDAWEKIRESHSNPHAGDAELDEPTRFDGPAPPWPLFVALLVAHGNFVRPRAFSLARGGKDHNSRRIPAAFAKLVLFVAAWGVAFATLPLSIPGIALVAWVAWIVPGVRQVHREFQKTPEGEPEAA